MNGRVAREEQQARNRADEDWTVRVPVTAGRREVAITFLDKAASIPNGKREPFLRPFPRGLNIPEGRYGSYLRRVEISGPYDATGPGRHRKPRAHLHAAARQPTSAAATPDAEACAKTILATLARRAYRRPVADADVAPLLDFYRAGHARRRQLRRRHPGRAQSLAREPRVPVPDPARSRRCSAGLAVPHR